MPTPDAGRPAPDRRRLCALLCILALLGGCAALTGQDAPRVSVAGIEPLPGAGLEMRFSVRLRVQNPNEAPIEFHGVSLQLDLNGKPFASGVSDKAGVVPRFGEALIDVPLTIPAFAAVRHAYAFATGPNADGVPYKIHGRLAGGMGGGTRFVDEGRMSLPMGATTPQ